MQCIRTLIVDDEEVARKGLRGLLERDPDIGIVEECTSGHEAVEALETHHPDLVFLDVEMPGLDGFDVLEQAKLTKRPFIIFVTAYDQYALRAFEVHAVDYLLKPFSDRRFREAMQQARVHIRNERLGAPHGNLSTPVDRLQEQRPSPSSSYLQRIAVKKRDRVTFLDVSSIDWIEAADNYVRLHVGGRAHLLRATLTELEEQLDPEQFVRIHRSRIVNISRVREARPLGSGDCLLVLEGGTRLTSSRTYREERRQALNLSA